MTGTAVFDHPILSGLFGDEEIAALLNAEAELRAMLAFESALAEAEAAAGLIPHEAGVRIAAACAGFIADIPALKEATARDGVVVPAFVKALRAAVEAPHGDHVHHGATSQDVIDTALALRLKQVLPILDRRLEHLVERLGAIGDKAGDLPLMAHTRMQRALPFTAADKLANWRLPLLRCRTRLDEIKPRLLVVSLGGPVGDRVSFEGLGDRLAEDLAKRLGLAPAPVWHAQRDGIAEFGSWLSLVSGSLGKMGQDIALMAQNELGEVRLGEGGSSSAMPHKSNPIAAEMLVTLARFNAGLLGTLHQALVHENERSGAAWSLEWMVLPQMIMATAASLRHAEALAANLTFVPLS
ncbi:3-carboxy-cis,cis-muconate cycloisomerase [Chelatococcus sp. GCM10030263]|uniref:3-carboxy-cis,cis-muconate cycloisomerase n=1 Tax=Chelatococcus sp. GCM10030263 TaxID=3273387 RepID=UPI0036205AB8